MSTFATASNTRLRGRRTAHAGLRVPAERRAGGLTLVEGLVLITLVVLVIAGTILTSHRAVSSQPTTTVHVESGQTLWDLARAHPVEGMTTAQTAELISRINDLGRGGLTAHTAVRVPRIHESESAVASR
jgi:hypothetical protein